MRNQENRRRAELAETAGKATRECASLQNQIALGAGRSEGRISQWISGDPTSPVARFFELVDRLARNPHTDASPLIAHAMAVHVQALSDAPCDIAQVLDHQVDVDGEEEKARHRFLMFGDTEGLRNAAIADAASDILLYSVLPLATIR